ncbi:MAG: hypothetical protein Kow0099_39520 [Candidatus Abyssubacteria bacterium]
MSLLPLGIERDYITILRHLRPPQPSASTLWWMLAAVVGAASLFAAFEIVSRVRRLRKASKASYEDFNQLALVCQLSPEEVKLLRQLTAICKVRYPDRFFTSFELFNTCLEEYGPDASGPLTEADVKGLRIIRNKIFFGERSKMPPVKSTRELKPNQRLHLKRIDNGKVFMAPVIEAGMSGLLVATPRVQGKYIEIKPGERFEIYFWRDRDASYHFESIAIGQSGAHFVITIFKHVEDVERTQRREFHRIETLLPVLATPITREELDKVTREQERADMGHPGIRAHVVNLSGAGMALVTKVPLKPNDLVYLELATDEENGPVPLIGKILSVSDRKLTAEYVTHAEFVGLSADMQERLFRFIYSQMPEGTLPVR